MEGKRSDGDQQDNEIKKREEVMGCDCPRSAVSKFFLHGRSEAEKCASEQKVFSLRGIVLIEDLEDGVQLQNKVLIKLSGYLYITAAENSYSGFEKGRH